ncbi:hypothetical protein [Nonomuraea rhizosphaerae]|uniref:hypothetical protein n=1 Tax=Nonomuraea rhizosphaerae TaxID=2665663 RepID=UPI001C5FC4BA|nr:hypothetical protein [Nonomuraea rhizosphaerae]
MAFLSRLFKRDDPLAEREEAHRQGMRDAREHPLGEFTDPGFQPAYVSEVRARERERVTETDLRLAAKRQELLERALGEQETILRELARADLRPPPPPSSPSPSPHVNGAGPAPAEDAFISIAEARRRRAEARRQDELRRSADEVHQARARLQRIAQEWESAVIERNHAVEAENARSQRLIAAYRGGVMRTHPRKEEIPSLWKGEVVAMDSSAESAAAISGRGEIVRIMEEVETRIEVWHAEVGPAVTRRSLPRDATPDPGTGRGPGHDPEDEPGDEPDDDPEDEPGDRTGDWPQGRPGDRTDDDGGAR